MILWSALYGSSWSLLAFIVMVLYEALWVAPTAISSATMYPATNPPACEVRNKLVHRPKWADDIFPWSSWEECSCRIRRLAWRIVAFEYSSKDSFCTEIFLRLSLTVLIVLLPENVWFFLWKFIKRFDWHSMTCSMTWRYCKCLIIYRGPDFVS